MRTSSSLLFVVALSMFVAGTSGCGPSTTVIPEVQTAPLSVAAPTTQFTAVVLTSGQSFFGTIENAESPYPVLTNVYYVQTQLNPETKEVKNILIKRGDEWHAPDRMVLNAQHILFMEPVTQNSTVAKLIDELTRKP